MKACPIHTHGSEDKLWNTFVQAGLGKVFSGVCTIFSWTDTSTSYAHVWCNVRGSPVAWRRWAGLIFCIRSRMKRQVGEGGIGREERRANRRGRNSDTQVR